MSIHRYSKPVCRLSTALFPKSKLFIRFTIQWDSWSRRAPQSQPIPCYPRLCPTRSHWMFENLHGTLELFECRKFGHCKWPRLADFNTRSLRLDFGVIYGSDTFKWRWQLYVCLSRLAAKQQPTPTPQWPLKSFDFHFYCCLFGCIGVGVSLS